MKKKIDRCKYNTANIPIGTLKTRRVAKQLSGSYCCWASMGGFRREAFMALMPPHLDFEFGPSVPLAESICKQCKQFVEVER